MRSWRGLIVGEPASKANSRKLVIIRGRPAFIKSAKARDYVGSLRAQVVPLAPAEMLRGELRLTAHIYYASRRPDLDASLILDGLQGLIYANDRQIREQHLHWHLDPDDPRAIVVLEEIEETD